MSDITILCIDDEALIHELISDILTEDKDVKFISAYDGSQGLDMFNQHHPDLVLLDVMMPGVSGYDICTKIRKHDNGKNVPVIFISGNKSLDDIIKGYESGGTDYIVKPFMAPELLKKVHSHLKVYQHIKDSSQNLSAITKTVLDIQSTNAKLYAICRFQQESLFLSDVNKLCESFFRVVNSFGTKGTLWIKDEQYNQFVSDDGLDHPISQNILEHVNTKRIFEFGHGRAIFNGKLASLLVNHVGDDIDNLILLLDGFEIALKALLVSESSDAILNQYREQNHQLSVKVTAIFEELTSALTQELTKGGEDNTISLEQEDAMVSITEKHRVMVDDLFNLRLKLDEQLTKVLTEFRHQQIDSKEESTTESISFF